MGDCRPVIARDLIATKDDVLALMMMDALTAVRARLPAYFGAAGTHDPAAFLGDMAKPLVNTLRSLAIEALRDERGCHLPPGEIDALVSSALTTGALVTRGVRDGR
ncbi:hypothetical protein [Nostoc linckia]|uniref:Uncharacterized protein n=1 Tax=Nostoc linckia z8 TaxID=1628746 RepID=A0A9Q5Z425_NOSLI|nr:hypothetical protein [Nostoc linckia]PHJ89333.1 hypothetical protein VF08_37755 [Nostoc linckia z8]